MVVAYVRATPRCTSDDISSQRRTIVAQKGTDGNAGAITIKGGDGAGGSAGTGRGGGNNARGKSSASQTKGE